MRVAVSMAVLLCVACGKSETSHDDRYESAADERAHSRAARMQSKTIECEAAIAKPDPVPCREACRLNNSNSCARLASFYEKGTGVPKDENRALELYRQACAGGSGIGCEGVAWIHQRRGIRESDGGPGDRWFRRSRVFHRVHCSQGYGLSCTRLGALFERGIGGPKDLAVAATYYRRACEAKHADGCAALERLSKPAVHSP